MKHFALRTPLSALAVAALLAGCEWTSSSGSSSWSSAYDNMNFSGTYRSTSTAASISTVSEGTSETSTKKNTISEPKTKADAGKKQFSGTFAHKKSDQTIVPGTVNVTIGEKGFTDNGSGGFTGDGLASGSYDQNGWTITLKTPLSLEGTISVSYDVSWEETTSVAGETTSTTTTSVTSITVSQSGQNLTIRFNNGIQMGGKFTAVNQTASAESTGYDTYNAQFEVSSGKESKFVGTLNYDTVTGYRMIDGSWTWGRNTYDIHGVGPSWR